MNETHLSRIAQELEIQVWQVSSTAELIEAGGTVPFIARYRKEATGTLDEVMVTVIRDRLEQLAELDKRREAIFKSLEERGLVTDELAVKLVAAQTLAELEDIYLPYRPKRRTRAMIARERGLEPLAMRLLDQDANVDPFVEAEVYLSEEKGVVSVEDALSGARDVIAEMASEDSDVRAKMRELSMELGVIASKIIKTKDGIIPNEEEASKFRDYFEWEEAAKTAPSHRVLAMMRGENEGCLSLSVTPPRDAAMQVLYAAFLKGTTPSGEQVREALEDGYDRLLAPSMETETRRELKLRADEAAITVFVDNLRELLLAPPLGGKNILALDPGFRTGCKLVCLDRQGKLLFDSVVYPHTGGSKSDEAAAVVPALCERFQIEAIAIGNGTAGRETETFVRGLGLPSSIAIVMVNESGASIYSASEVAREEFPDHDVTVRGAVSIGRRLMDPLAELVKIDPKSIGVGQYQHDVDQAALKRSLDDVVTSCVSGVGVEVNTASAQLLAYVAGLGPQLAKNIVTYRESNGAFRSRMELRKVPRLGPKAFEQCAGFLRIRDGKDPLDSSAVHPESYSVVDAMAKDLGCNVKDLMRDEQLRNKIDLEKYVTNKVGLPTLRDIMSELAKPGRDPRAQFEAFSFAEGVEKIEDLQPGMKLPGIVTNVTAFGAFIDIGVHQDGLVHISHLADFFVKDPSEVLKVQQRVMVSVLEVDLARKRISLSLKSDPFTEPGQQGRTMVKHETVSGDRRSQSNTQGGQRGAPRATKPQGNWFTDALQQAKKK